MHLANWLRKNELKVFAGCCLAVALFLANLPTIDRYNQPPKVIHDGTVSNIDLKPIEPLKKPKPVKLTQLTIKKKKPVVRAVLASRSYGGPNTYAAGNCTWYAKSRRPDLPNNLGNAITWLSRARSQGIPTGSTPRVGAVAWEPIGGLGHVAIVTAVRGGMVTVSEMNYRGLYVISTRTVAASHFSYIY